MYAWYKFGAKQPIMNGATSGGFKLQCIRNCYFLGARRISRKALGCDVNFFALFSFVYTLAWLSVVRVVYFSKIDYSDVIFFQIYCGRSMPKIIKVELSYCKK